MEAKSLLSSPRVCYEFEVEKILNISTDGSFQVQWAPAWVSKFHLFGCDHLIQEFLKEQEQQQQRHQQQQQQYQQQQQQHQNQQQQQKYQQQQQKYQQQQYQQKDANDLELENAPLDAAETYFRHQLQEFPEQQSHMVKTEVLLEPDDKGVVMGNDLGEKTVEVTQGGLNDLSLIQPSIGIVEVKEEDNDLETDDCIIVEQPLVANDPLSDRLPNTPSAANAFGKSHFEYQSLTTDSLQMHTNELLQSHKNQIHYSSLPPDHRSSSIETNILPHHRCCECYLEFSSFDELKDHLMTHTKKKRRNSVNRQLFSCNRCDYSCLLESQLTLHKCGVSLGRR